MYERNKVVSLEHLYKIFMTIPLEKMTLRVPSNLMQSVKMWGNLFKIELPWNNANKNTYYICKIDYVHCNPAQTFPFPGCYFMLSS